MVDPHAEFNTDQLIQDIVKVNAAYMPQQKPQHLLQRANSTLSNEQFNHVMKMTDPVTTGVGLSAIKGRAKVNEVRPTNSLVSKSYDSQNQVSSAVISSSTNKSRGATNSIEDKVVDLRHSVKLRNKKKKRSNVRLVAVVEDQSRSTHIVDSIESERVKELDISDEVAAKAGFKVRTRTLSRS
eukprot:gene36467-47486_t